MSKEGENGIPPVRDVHMPLLGELLKRSERYPEVLRVEGRSYPDALMVCLVVDSDDETVWDDISDIEQEVARDFPDVNVVFRECDLYSQSIQDFVAQLPVELAQQVISRS